MAAARAGASSPTPAPSDGLTVRFVGMMGFIRRSDNSLLVATPGHQATAGFTHVPFLMARKGSAVARALGLAPNPAVNPAAFDMELANANPADFVFRCLDHTDLAIQAGDGQTAVDNRADQLAQIHKIAPGKRLRANVHRWAHATVALHGGRLENSAAHPDAGKIWTFGSYAQPLTDAANFRAGQASVQLTMGADARAYTATGDAETLWVVSSAGPRLTEGDARVLDHGEVLGQFLVDATIPPAHCPTATGMITPATALPCGGTALASLGGGAAAAFPPYVELCYTGYFG
ncbi:MAG: hypothetical protein AB1635_06155 [Acidobacteriota bacterium]